MRGCREREERGLAGGLAGRRLEDGGGTALDRGAAFLKADKLVTGHNADDIAETVLLNILRGDIARCAYIMTGEDGPIPRCKPFKYTYEKEIVIYPFGHNFFVYLCLHFLSRTQSLVHGNHGTLTEG
ncbi:Cytoplasmic tRNA 2-thiolation protein 1 [Platanthera guangdongensis]|uniref:Cytoplasmic tRNA 2-thiolation protein 1 n=1 Tax=Platanthera guangdongensis TaxID=2320717 RepID=A0ABR2LBT7_9ASPA